MSSLKFALLLVVGGMAGAGFAAMTTGALPHFAAPRPALIEARPVDQAPAAPSWLERSVDALDTPAWPFGEEQATGGAAIAPLPYPDTADAPAYGYRPHGGYDHDMADRYADEEPQDYRDDRFAAPSFAPLPPAQDRAADAASRAADAARDVRAAEQAL